MEKMRLVGTIDLEILEGALYTNTTLEYSIAPYVQKYTKIYMVTKPEYTIKPETEYVVIILRVDGEYRTILCPREIFLETRLGDIIMSGTFTLYSIYDPSNTMGTSKRFHRE